MTNIELIKALQTTVFKYGELPVYLDASMLREYENSSVEDVVCHDEYVTLYNF